MNNESGQEPLIVTGMGRSGTSMVAGLLGASGLDLGPRMIEPTDHNPRGFNEDADVVALQQRIMQAATHEGPEGWVAAGETFDRNVLPWFADKARAYLARRAAGAGGPWGWKDPRSTLLLDFWREQAPGARFCLIYRDPWDVAASVGRLGAPELNWRGKALDVWLLYNRRVMDFLSRHPEQCLLVSSLRVAERPEELPRRLAEKFGLVLQAPAALERAIDTNLLRAPEHPRIVEEALAHPGVETTLDELHGAAAMPGALPRTGESRVSVVIPCYNDGEWLAEAVASVKRGRQANVEIVIVDDGSDDPATVETIDAMEGHGCRVVRQENRGVSAAFNAGVEAADGEFIIPLGADDRIHPNYLVEAVEQFQRDLKLDVVYAGINFFGERNNLYRPGAFDLIRLAGANYLGASAVIRRQAYLEVGGYDEAIPPPGVYGDWELWLRMASNGRRFHGLDSFLLDCRVRPGSMTEACKAPGNHERLIRHVVERHAGLYRERGAEIFVALRCLHTKQMLADRELRRALEERISQMQARLQRLEGERSRLRRELRRIRRQRDKARRRERQRRERMKLTWSRRLRRALRRWGRAAAASGGAKSGGGGKA